LLSVKPKAEKLSHTVIIPVSFKFFRVPDKFLRYGVKHTNTAFAQTVSIALKKLRLQMVTAGINPAAVATGMTGKRLTTIAMLRVL
jgi:hypothetical protein